MFKSKEFIIKFNLDQNQFSSVGQEFKLNRGIFSKFPKVVVNSVITIRFTGIYPLGIPRFANIVSHHPDVEFNDVIHYYLSTNYSSILLRFDKDNLCRGCSKYFKEDELRVQVKV